MIKKTRRLIPALMFGVLIASCERIEQQNLAGEPIDFGATSESISLEYGRFVSAVPVTQHLNILWFEQADKTIIGVRINTSRGTISKDVVRIERE